MKPPRRGKCGKRKVSINCGLPLCGALLDEGVKNNMPVAYCLAREALRAEPERRSANGKAAPEGGKCSKRKASIERCSLLLVHFQGLIRLRRVALTSRIICARIALRRCPARSGSLHPPLAALTSGAPTELEVHIKLFGL